MDQRQPAPLQLASDHSLLLLLLLLPLLS